MDAAERSNDFEAAIRSASKDERSTLWTAMPAVIVSWNAQLQTVTAQPTIQALPPTPSGRGDPITMPVCMDCPVQYPGGAGWVITWPLAAGDEGLLVFASRCIDSWWQSGGVQPPAEMRMHDLSDGYFLAGGRSQPRAIQNLFTGGVDIRAEDGSTHLRMSPGMVDVLGALHVSGAITSDIEVTAKTINLTTHVHGGVFPGSGLSGVPR